MLGDCDEELPAVFACSLLMAGLLPLRRHKTKRIIIGFGHDADLPPEK